MMMEDGEKVMPSWSRHVSVRARACEIDMSWCRKGLTHATYMIWHNRSAGINLPLIALVLFAGCLQ